jgi:hypothetical protein
MNKKNVDSPEGRKKIKGKYMGINVFRGGRGIRRSLFWGAGTRAEDTVRQSEEKAGRKDRKEETADR